MIHTLEPRRGTVQKYFLQRKITKQRNHKSKRPRKKERKKETQRNWIQPTKDSEHQMRSILHFVHCFNTKSRNKKENSDEESKKPWEKPDIRIPEAENREVHNTRSTCVYIEENKKLTHGRFLK